jgi:prepilin-type N-terminal cleavage/methylation domain-containing protein
MSQFPKRILQPARLFTLLEVLIALVLIAIAGSIIGIRISTALEEKQFQTSVDRLYAELESCRRQALNTQADWIASLATKKDRFILVRSCPEAGKAVTLEWPTPSHLEWNHKPSQRIVFLFSSTGKIAPAGLLEIVGAKKRAVWQLPELFSVAEGSDGALKRPDQKIPDSLP